MVATGSEWLILLGNSSQVSRFVTYSPGRKCCFTEFLSEQKRKFSGVNKIVRYMSTWQSCLTILLGAVGVVGDKLNARSSHSEWSPTVIRIWTEVLTIASTAFYPAILLCTEWTIVNTFMLATVNTKDIYQMSYGLVSYTLFIPGLE